MECQDVKEMLNAWVDDELPTEQAARMNQHFEICRSCSLEADALRILVTSLNAMPTIRVPAQLARKTMQKFRAGFKHPGIIEWWQGLGLGMRGATCGATIAGLLLGVVLGSSLTILQTVDATNSFIEVLYHTGGILP